MKQRAQVNLSQAMHRPSVFTRLGARCLALVAALFVAVPGQSATLSYDANGNLVGKDHGTQTFTYTYDALDRLIIEIRDFSPLQDYTYDPNGNRTALTIDGVTDPYNYAAYSNQLEATFAGQYTYDAAGNILSDPSGRTFEYDEAGRLARVYVSGTLAATYTYNAQNQRIRKETPTETILYHYDLAGNLISETDQTGAVLKAYLWQDGQPVAQITAAGTETVAYLHTDHLQTPRQASDQNGKVVWRWDDVDAFGVTSAEEDPDGDGNLVEVNLRFPGQYLDQETGLHYNWYRYYDPETGRYVTSDPIGLQGGFNTYGYASANPLAFVDPTGLYKWSGTVTAKSASSGGGAIKYTYTFTSECVQGERYTVSGYAGGFILGAGLRVGATWDNVEGEDGIHSGKLNPNVFEGYSEFWGLNARVYRGPGAGGGHFGQVYWGSSQLWGDGSSGGVDVAGFFGNGGSSITNIEREDCGCEVK